VVDISTILHTESQPERVSEKTASIWISTSMLHAIVIRTTSEQGAINPSHHRARSALATATLLSARKLMDMESDKPNMAKGYSVDSAIDDAAFILGRIEKRWSTK
jgi:hypothetical protein